MKLELRERAEQLAGRPYIAHVQHAETTAGGWMYLAWHSDLEGCLAGGQTVAEAVACLDEVRVDYIHSLLEDGLPVPEPSNAQAGTAWRLMESGPQIGEALFRRESPTGGRARWSARHPISGGWVELDRAPAPADLGYRKRQGETAE